MIEFDERKATRLIASKLAQAEKARKVQERAGREIKRPASAIEVDGMVLLLSTIGIDVEIDADERHVTIGDATETF